MFEHDTPHEAFGDELAHPPNAALLLAMGEEVPAVGIAPAHVAGVHPTTTRLAIRGLGVLEVLESSGSSSRASDELADGSIRHWLVILIYDGHLQDVWW